MTLQNGCSTSEINIFPPNWKTKKADVNATWYISYRFKDPRFKDKYPNGKQFQIKSGLNRIKDLGQKREAIEFMYKSLVDMLEAGFNPITDRGEDVAKIAETIVSDVSESKEINYIEKDKDLREVLPSTPWIQALWFAHSKSELDPKTVSDTGSGIRSLGKAAVTLQFEKLPISEIQVKHMKLCLDECHRSTKSFTAKRFNKVKAYTSSLFKDLVQRGACFGNMCAGVLPMREGLKERIALTEDEIELVKEHLWTYNRPFYKFMIIFYYSGGRISELLRLRGRHVDLVNQTYKSVVKKGRKERSVIRTIRNVALPLWREQMETCRPDDFVFNRNLLPAPGVNPMSARQITLRWRDYVKKPLGIKANFYFLKHLNADRTTEATSLKVAAGQMGHTSTQMAETVYAYNEQKRIHRELKELDIQL